MNINSSHILNSEHEHLTIEDQSDDCLYKLSQVIIFFFGKSRYIS